MTGFDSVALGAGGQIMAGLVPGSVELWNLATGARHPGLAQVPAARHHAVIAGR